MQNSGNNIRIELIALLIGIIIMNVGYTYMMFNFDLNSDIEKYENFIAKVELGEIETTKDRYLESVTGWKKYIVASDELMHILQKSIGLLAIANIVLVTLIVLLILRKDKKYREKFANKTLQSDA